MSQEGRAAIGANAENRADVAVVGEGIVGLAHALAAARRGLKVVVFERNGREIAAFERRPGWRAADDLRRWDDLAKDPDLRVPPLESYERDLRAVAAAHHDRRALSRQKGSVRGTQGAQ